MADTTPPSASGHTPTSIQACTPTAASVHAPGTLSHSARVPANGPASAAHPPAYHPADPPTHSERNRYLFRYRLYVGLQTVIFLLAIFTLFFSCLIVGYTEASIYKSTIVVPLVVSVAYLLCAICAIRTQPVSAVLLRPKKCLVYMQVGFFWPWLAITILCIWTRMLYHEDVWQENSHDYYFDTSELIKDLLAVDYDFQANMARFIISIAGMSASIAIATVLQLIAINSMATLDVPYQEKAAAYRYIVGSKNFDKERAAAVERGELVV